MSRAIPLHDTGRAVQADQEDGTTQIEIGRAHV